MNIAIVGTRGIPARYGGFETLADQLSKRLVERRHTVTVYCRKPFTSRDDVFDQRIRRVILPSLPSMHSTPCFTPFCRPCMSSSAMQRLCSSVTWLTVRSPGCREWSENLLRSMSTDSIESAGNGISWGSGFCICASCFLLTPLREL